jgi:hypothetical protein
MIKRGKAQKKAARSARLAAALRENLKRRKAQARGRTETAGAGEGKADSSVKDATMGTSPPDFRHSRSRE